MNLLILPGAGNPDTSSYYSQVYGLMEKEAHRYDYQEVFLSIRWPGQSVLSEFDQAPSLTLQGAIETAKNYIEKMPDEPYSILARSFGCFVALNLVGKDSHVNRKPSKVILWGPVPFWGQWKMWKRELQKWQGIGKEKGVKITEDYFTQLEPIEYLIQNVTVPAIVVSGSEDEYCSPSFMEYLRSICEQNPFVSVKSPVQGLKHDVTEAVGDEKIQIYAKVLFE